jgi:Tfp pilus assembly ATPase PilU
MNKIDLEVKIESLRTMVQESQQSASNYTGQLVEMEKRLADINKVALSPSQFDDITEAIEEAVNEYDFTDTDNFEIEYGIDYDGRVHCESHEFRNHENLVEMVCNKVYALFAEAELPEDEFDRTEVDNHKPVE